MNRVAERPARVHVLDIPIDPLTVDDLHRHLGEFIAAGTKATILHVNVHAMNLAAADPSFASILRGADLVFCDGHGVMLAARLVGQRIPAKITYAEWTWQLAAWCQREGRSLFLLGSRPGVADAAARRLEERYPALRVTGTHHGYFAKEPGTRESLDVLTTVNAARPDIVLVGFGMPLQERWVTTHRHLIDAPVVLTAGAALDYVSGRLTRPPQWMTRHGLEWLGRLVIEPRRLARRYVVGNPTFFIRVLRARLRRS